MVEHVARFVLYLLDVTLEDGRPEQCRGDQGRHATSQNHESHRQHDAAADPESVRADAPDHWPVPIR